ncbi:MAG: MFS transporter [Pseudomonadota bacterium]
MSAAETPGTALKRTYTEFDGWRSISLGLYMVLVGYGVLVGIPVISTAWVNLLGFTEVEVGRVAGADLGGLSLGAVLAAIVIARVDRRWLVAFAIVLAVAANALCMVTVEYEQVLWLRLVAGIGSGIYTAVAVATLGATVNPARAFNLALFAFAFSQALELYFLPKLSMNGIYLVFIVCYLLSLLFLGWLPRRPTDKALDVELDAGDDETGHRIEHRHVPAYVPWLVLAAMFVTYINIGAYWTYIELASVASEASPEWVGRVLVWTAFFSVLGCLFATVFSRRYGLARPLLVTLIVQAVIVAMLANGINDSNIVISLFAFNFLWIFIDVYQMATVANVDHSGRFAALMPGAQGLGQIVGPNIAASILAAGFGYRGVFIMCATASLVAMAIYLTMYLRLRRTIPELADAS